MRRLECYVAALAIACCFAAMTAAVIVRRAVESLPFGGPDPSQVVAAAPPGLGWLFAADRPPEPEGHR